MTKTTDLREGRRDIEIFIGANKNVEGLRTALVVTHRQRILTAVNARNVLGVAGVARRTRVREGIGTAVSAGDRGDYNRTEPGITRTAGVWRYLKSDGDWIHTVEGVGRLRGAAIGVGNHQLVGSAGYIDQVFARTHQGTESVCPYKSVAGRASGNGDIHRSVRCIEARNVASARIGLDDGIVDGERCGGFTQNNLKAGLNRTIVDVSHLDHVGACFQVFCARGGEGSVMIPRVKIRCTTSRCCHTGAA